MATPSEPSFNFKPARREIDLATVFGLVAAVALIGAALSFGGQSRIFWDVPSFIIVVGGTAAITLMASSWGDLSGTLIVLKSTFASPALDQNRYAKQLIDLAMIARQKGVIHLQHYEAFIRSDGFLTHAVKLAVDGMKPEEIDNLLKQDINSAITRQDQAVRLLRRAADIAPAMGLIGTLVGLVQMLGKLVDPASIGPSMALALLTTFYGAILGTVILAPLATKLEKRADEDMMNKAIAMAAALSMARQENPRLLEIQLNTLLSPKNRVKYFEE
jgi:chemotaxis protein MotA